MLRVLFSLFLAPFLINSLYAVPYDFEFQALRTFFVYDTGTMMYVDTVYLHNMGENEDIYRIDVDVDSFLSDWFVTICIGGLCLPSPPGYDTLLPGEFDSTITVDMFPPIPDTTDTIDLPRYIDIVITSMGDTTIEKHQKVWLLAHSPFLSFEINTQDSLIVTDTFPIVDSVFLTNQSEILDRYKLWFQDDSLPPGWGATLSVRSQKVPANTPVYEIVESGITDSSIFITLYPPGNLGELPGYLLLNITSMGDTDLSVSQEIWVVETPVDVEEEIISGGDVYLSLPTLLTHPRFIEYRIPYMDITLSIYDITGRRVFWKTVKGREGKIFIRGNSQDGKILPDGMYIMTLEREREREILLRTKFLIIRQ